MYFHQISKLSPLLSFYGGSLKNYRERFKYKIMYFIKFQNYHRFWAFTAVLSITVMKNSNTKFINYQNCNAGCDSKRRAGWQQKCWKCTLLHCHDKSNSEVVVCAMKYDNEMGLEFVLESCKLISWTISFLWIHILYK